MTIHDVDVVVPVHRPGPWLPIFVGSILASRDVRLRLIVIDDLPGDPAVAAFVSRNPQVELDVPKTNLGFAAAVNRGIEFGEAPFVALINQDARVEPNTLAGLCGHLANNEELAAVGPKVLRQASPDVQPDGTIDSAGIEMRRGRRPVDIGQGDIDRGQFDARREVFGVCAAMVVYRRSALVRVAQDGQVMDESFFMHKEDVDLAWRLRRQGFRSAIDGSLRAYHARGTSRLADGGIDRGKPWGSVRAVIRSERAKGATIRRLAWRNQVRMVVKNDTRKGLARSLPWLLAIQLGYLAVGIALDPIGTLADRFWLIRDARRLIDSRNGSVPHVDLPNWLP